MLFLLCIVLPYQFSQVSSQSEEARDIVENARDLFNAVAKNESEMVGKFVSALRKNEEKLETEYDNLKKALESSVRKHGHQPNFIQRNGTIKRGADSGLPDYKAEFEKIKGQMKATKLDKAEDQVDYLLQLLVDERADHERTNTLKTGAEKDKGTVENEACFYKMLMGMRNRVDILLNLLWPRDIPCPNSRFYQLMFLFVIGNGNYYIQQLRELINQCGMNFEQFSMYLQNVYRDDANQPVHTIKVPPCTPAEIEGACAAAKFELGDDMTKPILRVLFCKLNQTKAPDGKILIPTNEADNRYRCLVLANVPYELREEKKREGETENPQKPKPEDLLDQSIEKKLRTQFFERYITEKKLIEKIERLDKPVIKEGSLPNRRSFLIKFYNVHDALDAFLKHMTKPFAEEKRIGISVRNCNNLYTDNLDEIIRPRPPIPKTVSDPESGPSEDDTVVSEKPTSSASEK